MSLQLYVRYGRKHSIYRPGARVPVWAWIRDPDAGETAEGGTARLEAFVAGDGERATGATIVVDETSLTLVERPYVSHALLGDLHVHRAPLEELGYPTVGLGLLVRVLTATPPQEATHALELGHGVEPYRWYSSEFRKRKLFGSPTLKGASVQAAPGPYRFGEAVDIATRAEGWPVEVGLRCSSFGPTPGVSQGLPAQVSAESTIWQTVETINEPEAVMTLTIPSGHPPTHDGGIGVRWSVFARDPHKKHKRVEVDLTVEG